MVVPLIAVVVVSIAFIVYVLVGYPLLLHLLASRRGRPWRKEFHPKTVSVIMPVRNGERWIQAKLETLADLNYPAELIEIFVISDGSTDGTAELVRSWGDPRVHLIELPHGGKATALNTGIAQARGEILFLTDVRQALDPDSLQHLVSCFADPQVGAVSGELIIRKGDSSEEANVGLYWRYEKWIRKNMSRLDSLLGATGAIYAIRRELAATLPSDTLLDDVYLPLGTFFRGYRVVMEEQAKAFDFPTSLNQEFHRKVRTLAGVYQVVGFYPVLLNPAENRMWLHFFSHKLARLLVPYALILILLCSLLLPPPFNWLLLLGQLAFYGAAALDPVIPEKFPAKKLTSPIRTFVVLMTAALCAVSILFRSGQQLWKQTQIGPANPAA